MKYIIFEFHFYSFNSASGIATGITAKEITVAASFLRLSLYKSTPFTEVYNYSRSYTIHYYTLLQSVKSAIDVFILYFHSSAMFKLRVL